MIEVKRGLPVDLVQFLIDRIPPEEIDAARIYLKVLKSQEVDSVPWFSGDPENKKPSVFRADLLFRSVWLADEHRQKMSQTIAIFRFAKILDDRWDSVDLRNWIQTIIRSGDLILLPDSNLTLSPELARIASARSAYWPARLTHSE